MKRILFHRLIATLKFDCNNMKSLTKFVSTYLFADQKPWWKGTHVGRWPRCTCYLWAQHESVQNKWISLYRSKHMDATEHFLCVHCSRISEKGLSSLRHNSSILFYHTHISLSVSLYYSVGSNSQTDRSKKKYSRKRKINTTGCIQIVYYQGPLFSPFLKNNV